MNRPSPTSRARTPLGGEGKPVSDAQALRASHATNLGEQLSRAAPGVSINETQGNPLQPDISYRGFTASPLLGTPQGLSVYLDGVRINQPFGDVVSWDLIPTSIIRSADLVSGAAPQFGRNSLGGALSVRLNFGHPLSARIARGDRLHIRWAPEAAHAFGRG